MLRTSNAEELACIAQEIGVEAVHGPVRYPSQSGDIAVGAVDIGEYLYELKGQEIMLILAPLEPLEELPIICGLCGTPYRDDECPTRKTQRVDAKRVIEEKRRSEREEDGTLVEDIEKWLGRQAYLDD